MQKGWKSTAESAFEFLELETALMRFPMLHKGGVMAWLRVGSFVLAFGPGNTYPVLHLLYGPKYSSTQAPQALAFYCPYMLLLAVNGIMEAFVHAVAEGKALVHGHLALISITIIQTMVTIPLVLYTGTLGMIAADSLGMVLRILYCTYSIFQYQVTLSAKMSLKDGLHMKGSASTKSEESISDPTGVAFIIKDRHTGPAHSPSLYRPGMKGSFHRILSEAFPSIAMLFIFAFCSIGSNVSCATFLGAGPFKAYVKQKQMSFLKSVLAHASVQILGLILAAVCFLRKEIALWKQLHSLQKKEVWFAQSHD